MFQWPVNLAPAANADYRWRPSAEGNDLGEEQGRWGAMPGEIGFEGIRFRPADLEKYPRHTMLLLAGKERRTTAPFELELTLPPNRASAFALLHAQAWPEEGDYAEITAVYGDGNTEKIKLNGLQTALDWLTATPLENGRIAFRSSKNSSHGLYASVFPLSQTGPVKLRFRLTASRPVWMVVAVTLLEKPVVYPPYSSYVITAGEKWIPMKFSSKTVPGSPLDFSAMLDAPAGKYGFLRTAPDGTFRFENSPEQPVRFHGMNLFRRANFPTREQAVALVNELACSGCNLIRIHCQDEFMMKKNADDALDFDEEQLDRLEFLFAEAKKKGLYVSIDLVGLRRFLAGDGLDDQDRFGIQRQTPINPKARDNVKAFARKWLTRINPHTGIAWKDDPALVFVNLINEENITAWIIRKPDVERLYYSAYRKAKGLKPDAPVSRFDPGFIDFAYEMQYRALRGIADFARDEIGLRVPFSILNFKEDPYLAPLRARFDYVDNHAYYDHPTFPGRLRFGFPYHHHQKSAVSELGRYPTAMMPTRVFGKPMAITEYGYTFPNRFRCEGGPLLGAYACLQDWDALVCFAWTSYFDQLGYGHPVNSFSVYNDPIKAYTNRIVSLLFLRRLVSPASEAYRIPIPAAVEEAAGSVKSYTKEQETLGLITRIGSTVSDSKLPEWNRTAGNVHELYRRALDTGRAVSSTGELDLDSRKGVFQVVTPRAVCLTQHQGDATAGPLTVSEVKTPQSVSLIALDDKPVAESASLLLFHLTDSANEGTSFVDETRTMMTAFGEGGKLLILRSVCRVALTGCWRITALGLNGEIKQTVPVEYRNGSTHFTLDTRAFNGTLVYHVTPGVISK